MFIIEDVAALWSKIVWVGTRVSASGILLGNSLYHKRGVRKYSTWYVYFLSFNLETSWLSFFTKASTLSLLICDVSKGIFLPGENMFSLCLGPAKVQLCDFNISSMLFIIHLSKVDEKWSAALISSGKSP